MSPADEGTRLAIRRASPEDVPVLLKMIKELARYERLEDRVVADEAGLEDALFGPSLAAEAALATLDGHPAAFAVWFCNFSTFEGRRGLYLEDLYVRPEHRGRGHGLTLFRFVARRALELGCARMEWAVLDWNEPAIAFYRRLGAVPLDDWTVFRLTPDTLRRFAEDGGAGRR